MSAPTPEPEIVTLEPTPVAVLRETVPMAELTEYFGRAFEKTMAVAEQQSIALAGPPLAVYYGMPGETSDLGGGFPTERLVDAYDGVTGDTLPGGRAVQLVHVGSYDGLTQTYDRLMAWIEEQKLSVQPTMWEIYLTEPDPANPEATLTRIVWPIAE